MYFSFRRIFFAFPIMFLFLSLLACSLRQARLQTEWPVRMHDDIEGLYHLPRQQDFLEFKKNILDQNDTFCESALFRNTENVTLNGMKSLNHFLVPSIVNG